VIKIVAHPNKNGFYVLDRVTDGGAADRAAGTADALRIRRRQQPHPTRPPAFNCGRAG
jgi:hypothetical protein